MSKKVSSSRADVVIIGGGIAGLATGIAATTLGLSVLLIEGARALGGSTSRSYGGIWVANSDDARSRGLADDRASAMRYMEFISAGQADPARVSAFVDAAPRALSLLSAAGMNFQQARGVNDHFYGRAPGSRPHGRSFEVSPFAGQSLGRWRPLLMTPHGDAWRIPLAELIKMTKDRVPAAIEAARQRDDLSQGAGLIANSLEVALQRGVSIRVGVGAEKLLTSKGRVIGVQADDGRRYMANTGVVIACGGFESDIALTQMVENLPGYLSVYPPNLRGDGLRLAGELGAALHIIHHNNAVFMAYQDPASGEATVIANREMGAPHGLVVNRRGKRFGNEASFQEFAPGLRHFSVADRQAENLPCWLIFDEQFARTTGLGPPGPKPVPDWVVRADRLDALATKISIDPFGLTNTTARLEQFAIEGKDHDFARGECMWSLAPMSGTGPNPSLGAVAHPPFYAVKLHPTIIGASGLKADAAARVLNWRNRPIPGLFAVGNAAAHDEYGAGYQAGQSISSALAFGLLAVEAMAAQSGHIVQRGRNDVPP